MRNVFCCIFLSFLTILTGCAGPGSMSNLDETDLSVTDSCIDMSWQEITVLEDEPGIHTLRFETAEPEELGNSVSNLMVLGLVVGDAKQLYTVEYWPRNLEWKKEGMQIYVSDNDGKRCLTNEDNIVGYLNITDSAVYYVDGDGIAMIERNSETVKQVVSTKEVSFLLVVKNKMYYIDTGVLYSFDLDSNRKKRIASPVVGSYLDYEEGRLFFCLRSKDIREQKTTLCALMSESVIEKIYAFDESRLRPCKIINANTLICYDRVKEDPQTGDQYELIVLDLQNNTKRVLVSDYNFSFMKNGEQIIAGSGRGEERTHFLINLIDGTARMIPDWGGGALNATADRLFAVNVVDVKIRELRINNDQFSTEPLN